MTEELKKLDALEAMLGNLVKVTDKDGLEWWTLPENAESLANSSADQTPYEPVLMVNGERGGNIFMQNMIKLKTKKEAK